MKMRQKGEARRYVEPFYQTILKCLGPIAERSKLSDLDCGPGDPGSNPGKGMCFFRDGELSGSRIACLHMW